MSYIDGYVIPVKKSKVKAYMVMARLGYKMWMKHGALDYKECVGDDLKNSWGASFTKLLKLKPSETVIFSYIVFKSRAHRDSINKKVIKDMESFPMPKEMPFEMKRMVYGGFKAVVEK